MADANSLAFEAAAGKLLGDLLSLAKIGLGPQTWGQALQIYSDARALVAMVPGAQAEFQAGYSGPEDLALVEGAFSAIASAVQAFNAA